MTKIELIQEIGNEISEKLNIQLKTNEFLDVREHLMNEWNL